MVRWWVLAVACCMAQAAQAQSKPDVDPWTDKLLTKETTIVCESSYRVADAAKAYSDPKWMREIGCIYMRHKLPVTILEPSSLYAAYKHGSGRPWRVRVTMPDGEGFTVYTTPLELTLLDGREIPSRFW